MDMKENPTVLDYVKALLTPWRGAPPRILPPDKEAQSIQDATSPSQDVVSGVGSEAISGIDAGFATLQTTQEGEKLGFPADIASIPASQLTLEPAPLKQAMISWRSLLALFFALAAQFSLEPRANRTWLTGVVLYVLAAALIILANLRGEWLGASFPLQIKKRDPLTMHRVAFFAAVILAAAAFLLFGNNHFTIANFLIWLLSIFAFLYAFWLPTPQTLSRIERLRRSIQSFNPRDLITGWTVLVLVTVALVIFFRVYRLNDVPPEMTSDHAEKLLDVWDVLHGQTSIFFPRNTGREALQFYLTAAIVRFLGTGYTFLSLKISTMVAGLLTLPFIYLLGKEVGNRRVGLMAVIFTGIAYWPNAITRDALRFTLYPLFVAPCLFFLLRGMRTSNRNDFLLAGLALGIGLHGYSPIRILPVVLAVAVCLYIIHRQSKGVRTQTIIFFALLCLIGLAVFSPLLRYAISNPETFNYRILTRLGPAEQPLPGPALQVFLQNLWRGVTAFSWDNGEIWVHVVPHRPALDVVSGALFFLGICLLLLRYFRKRHWLDLFLLLSVPLLMMPSILSLAFPNENPAMNRAAGALVPVFLIIGIALEGLLSSLQAIPNRAWGRRLAIGLGTILVLGASIQNYDLLFNQFRHNYALSSWNSSEMGQVIRTFSNSFGSYDRSWVVPYPYWVDTRLVGFNAGYPTKDYALWPDHFIDTLALASPKLFLLNPADIDSLQALQKLYPQGQLEEYRSKTENKNFLIFLVPTGS